MNRYKTMKRPAQKRLANKQIIATQKKLVRGVLVLFVFVFLIIFVFGDHGIFQLYKIKKERKNIQDHIFNLRKEREALVTEKNRLENDLLYIEKLAREKYRMAKPGEKVFKVLENNKIDD